MTSATLDADKLSRTYTLLCTHLCVLPVHNFVDLLIFQFLKFSVYFPIVPSISI